MPRRIADFHRSQIQKLIKELRRVEILPRRLLVAVSGGVDSVALLLALDEIKALFNFELMVAYVHHGLTLDESVNRYRLLAQEKVRSLAKKRGLSFITNEAKESMLHSEASLRDLRFTYLDQWMKEHSMEAIVLAHHFEDLVETQMMRLFRGTSSYGLSAMTLFSPKKRLRPLLNFKKADLKKFVESQNESWVEDPSNEEFSALRNKVRHWLKEIEVLHPGAQENLAKSLQQMAQLTAELKNPWKEEVLTNGGISRDLFMGLAHSLKAELLADYLRSQGVRNYTSGQIFELIKRLDVPQKESRFTYLGCHWTLEPEMIRRVSGV